MSLFVASLNSGSNGNSYYIGDDESAVLVDVGISAREVAKRLARLEIPLSRIKGIFVSHEHGDHIHGVPGLSKKYRIPVYITEKTLAASTFDVDQDLIRYFEPYKEIQIDTISVVGFPKFHDAADPHSFVIQNHKVNVGVFTDIGRVCDQVKHYFKKCHAVFLETNYDDIMLEHGGYPDALKRRIRGGLGHLSNREAFDLVESTKSPVLTHLFLSHLSQNNNTPGIVENLFQTSASKAEVTIASRRRESALIKITGNGKAIHLHPLEVYEQLKLF